MNDQTISALEGQIRDLINGARKQHSLLKDAAAWNQLCSSLDVIGDTEAALDAYLSAAEPNEPGATYLLVYGVLQGLIMQQDAARHLSEALHFPYAPDELLLEIREVRNGSVGHPTKRWGKDKSARSHFISRSSMSKAGFQLMTAYADGAQTEFRWVDLPKLVTTQRSRMSEVLRQVVEALRREEERHKAMFKGKTLAAAFPQVINYYFEKLYESLHSSNPRELGRAHVSLIRDAVDGFKAGLTERGILEAHASVNYHLDLVAYPLDRLDQYFSAGRSAHLNERDAFIFVSFVQDQVSQLRNMAREIDEDYTPGGLSDDETR